MAGTRKHGRHRAILAAAVITALAGAFTCATGSLTIMEKCTLNCDSFYRDCAEACGGYRMGDTQDSRRRDAVLYGAGDCVERCDTRHRACRGDCEQYKSYDSIEEK